MSTGDKARKGVLTLGLRQAVIQVINFVFTIALARLLAPADYGVYALVTAGLVVLSALGDLGLSAALLQRSGEPSQRQISQVFTVQMAVLLPAVALLAVVAFVVAETSNVLSTGSAAMVAVAGSSFVWLGFRSSAAAQFEARLEYGWMSRAEIAEVLAFQLTATISALAGLGPWSFVLALHARGLVGSSLLWVKAPVRPSVVRDLAGLGDLVRFGLKYQAGWAGEALGSVALPLAVAPAAGAAGLGYYLNAYNNVNRLTPISALVGRVALPGLSRLREMSDSAYRNAIERGLCLVALPGIYWCGLQYGLGDDFIEVLFGSKWLPSVPLLYALAPLAIALPISTFCGTALAAGDRAGVRGVLMWARLVLLFPVFLFAGWVAGARGVAVAASSVEVSLALISLVLLGRATLISSTTSLVRLTPSAVGAATVAWAVTESSLPALARLVLGALAAGVVFLILALLTSDIVRRELTTSLRMLRQRGYGRMQEDDGGADPAVASINSGR